MSRLNYIIKPEQFKAFRESRPDMPLGTIPALEEHVFGSASLMECRDCGVYIAATEYEADYDYDEGGWQFCGRQHCAACWGDE